VVARTPPRDRSETGATAAGSTGAGAAGGDFISTAMTLGLSGVRSGIRSET
jgi:hypothetical protein